MFYPVDCLRRGGRFYLPWVADSWPHRFASISQRQLWSQDIPTLCEDIKIVMISESGRARQRYSLRLSSQLLRGLVRIYQRKVNVFLNELCMIHATVMKHSNKRYNIQEQTEARVRPPQASERRATVALVEEPENYQRVEEILQNSGNVVANIQDITLKEAVIAEPVVPPNEGFGEENAEQALLFLSRRRSVEQMLAPGEPGADHSALELAAGAGARALHAPRATHLRMESISGQDLSMLRPSDGGLLSITDLGKEIPDIPDIPILPFPELPDPQEKLQEPAAEIAIEQPREELSRIRERETARESTQIELEELEEIEPRAKRRKRLIIDKKIEITSDVFRAGISNTRIECKDCCVPINLESVLPYELYMNRPCHAGYKERCNIAPALTRLFMRNLGVVNRDTHREFEEEEMLIAQRYRSRSHLGQIPEDAEFVVPPEPQIEKAIEAPIEDVALEADMSKGANIPEQDIADMVTLKLETLSQQKASRKRASDDAAPSPKVQKSVGYMSLRENQQRQRGSATAGAEADMLPELDIVVDKENICPRRQASPTKRSEEGNIAALLHEAGLLDMPARAPTYADMELPAPAHQTKQARRPGSESSESLLGSLDRTKVSLGDSDTTTDSKRFIRDQWGAEGTMYKIVKCVRNKRRGETITIRNLIEIGPIISQYKNIITAKCFSSILKLKQNGLVIIKKCPITLEILDITLGSGFNCTEV